jgi:hypothetical protein
MRSVIAGTVAEPGLAVAFASALLADFELCPPELKLALRLLARFNPAVELDPSWTLASDATGASDFAPDSVFNFDSEGIAR